LSLKKNISVLIALLFIFLCCGIALEAQTRDSGNTTDEKVRSFLKHKTGRWYDMNVPESDGRILYDLILKNNYKSALEIGTSTGHSGIWMAWALSKTGGRLITIEIDESRHRKALENFREAGLSEYVDTRLADAHQLVKELPGPFDFVFCDADKEWYKNYFIDIEPSLRVGACFTAHNVTERNRGYGGYGGQAVFLEYVRSLKNYKTTINSSGQGISISYKIADR